MTKSTISICLLMLALLCTGMATQASELTLQAGVFYYPDPSLDTVTLVEFPFSVNRDDFEFYQADSTNSQLYARIFAEVKLLDKDGLAVDSAKTYFSVVASSKEDAARTGMKLFDNLALLVRPGEYTARLTVIDAVSKKKGEAFFDNVVVEPTLTHYLNLGGPLLAYSARYVGNAEDVNPRLVHNGFLLHANPLGVFSTNDTTVYLYAELYNIKGTEDDPPLKIEYRLESELGRVAQDYGFKLQKRVGNSIVLREALDIKSVLEGTYYLRMMVSDSMNNQSVVERIPLILLEPTRVRDNASRQLAGDPFDTLSIADKVNITWHELNPNQQAMIKNLTDSGKQNYLEQFWREHDDQPLTRRIERREEMVKRYLYANQNFSTDFDRNDGWLTDRGRIYMLHGEPDRIRTQEMPTASSPGGSNLESTAPYQVWDYFQIEEGKEVVFVDYDGMGEYTLAHSTFDGDLYSEYWHSVLRGLHIEIE